jgi:four helix bundle protein
MHEKKVWGRKKSMTNDGTKKIQHFTDLVVWQKAHALVLRVYAITRAYPKDEMFGLVSQSRRAAVSITSNIAEGFGRVTKADKTHFYWLAKASLAELQSQLYIVRDLKYVSTDDVHAIMEESGEVERMLGGLIGSSQTFRS